MEEVKINLEEGKEYTLTLSGAEAILVHKLLYDIPMPYGQIAPTIHKIEAQLLKQTTIKEEE